MRIYTLQQAAKKLDMNPLILEQYAVEGAIMSMRIGGKLHFEYNAIEKYRQQHTGKGTINYSEPKKEEPPNDSEDVALMKMLDANPGAVYFFNLEFFGALESLPGDNGPISIKLNELRHYIKEMLAEFDDKEREYYVDDIADPLCSAALKKYIWERNGKPPENDEKYFLDRVIDPYIVALFQEEALLTEEDFGEQEYRKVQRAGLDESRAAKNRKSTSPHSETAFSDP